MGETFEHRDLCRAVFRDVNLYRALFEDVNLGAATIQNANLGDVSIVNANIKGLTIFGVRVDQLIEAELDRRDPERVRLRMTDPHDPEDVRAVLERLDEVRGRFSEALRAADANSRPSRRVGPRSGQSRTVGGRPCPGNGSSRRSSAACRRCRAPWDTGRRRSSYRRAGRARLPARAIRVPASTRP